MDDGEKQIPAGRDAPDVIAGAEDGPGRICPAAGTRTMSSPGMPLPSTSPGTVSFPTLPIPCRGYAGWPVRVPASVPDLVSSPFSSPR